MDYLDAWGISREEFNNLIEANGSLRGMLLGYVAEYQLKTMWFTDERISRTTKYDDHDRARKGDLAFFYKGVEIRVESKSLQTHTIKQVGPDAYEGAFQCDASDRRKVTLPSGQVIETTNLIAGEFDLLAVNLFGFGNQWRFGFAKNLDLPRSSYRGYPEEVRKFLLATQMKISWPLQPPYEDEPFRLLDEIVELKQQGQVVSEIEIERKEKAARAEVPVRKRPRKKDK